MTMNNLFLFRADICPLHRAWASLENLLKIKQIKNLHFVTPRVCSQCKYFYYFDGMWNCKRSMITIDGNVTLPFGSTDAGDGYQHRFVCDRWVSDS
jgi:hypothetical protein